MTARALRVVRDACFRQILSGWRRHACVLAGKGQGTSPQVRGSAPELSSAQVQASSEKSLLETTDEPKREHIPTEEERPRTNPQD